jgi:hypothetical protein
MVRIFQTVRMRIENVDVAEYIAAMMQAGGAEGFKKGVMKDLDTRRDLHAPEESRFEKKIA